MKTASQSRRQCALLALSLLFLLDGARAATIDVVASAPAPTPTPTPVPFVSSKDNSLYQSATGQLSNGKGIFLFAGKTNETSNSLRRGLVAFDLSTIPANVTVTAASLSLYLTKMGPIAPGNISVSRMLRDWGEGNSNSGSPGGHGVQAQTNDATWLHNFYNTSFWNTPGGDFSPTHSATAFVEVEGIYHVWSGPGLVADVQAWVSNPASNFGWVILGNEIDSGSAAKFNTRENTANKPRLNVTFQTSTPTPTPTPTPTLTPPPTPTPAPTPPPAVSISGTVIYCTDPAFPPVPGVTMTRTGTSGDAQLTDGSGNYSFEALTSGGSYAVMPSRTALPPGVDGIDGGDVVAVIRHFLEFPPLIPPGCQLDAADADTQTVGIAGSDIVAIQRFYLGFANSATSRAGQYQFTPASRSYPALTSNQTGQNYNVLIYGDVAAGFVYRLESDPSQDAGEDGTDAGEFASAVAAVALPDVALNRSMSNFTPAVTTSPIDAKNKLVGFQGNITFDERGVAFDEGQPAQAAGLTAGNWSVSGHVLPGPGPIRTLRLLGYSNDFTPLSGQGTLFELKMTRVSNVAESAQLIWAAPPHQFLFIDADSRMQPPDSATSGPSQR